MSILVTLPPEIEAALERDALAAGMRVSDIVERAIRAHVAARRDPARRSAWRDLLSIESGRESTEDAQEWVSRTRRESDSARELAQ